MFLRTPDPERLTARVVGNTRTAGCRVETYRDGDNFNIDIDLPGVDPANVDVTVDRDVMTVRASRNTAAEKPRAEETVDCAKQIPLAGALDTDRLDARYDNGVLTVSIPVRDQAA